MQSRKIILGVIAIMLMATSSFSQDGKYGATEEDSITCTDNLSLYVEYYKQKEYKDALIGWRWVYNYCPRSKKKIYTRGVTMYKSLSRKEKDPVKKAQYIDTLMGIYDRRIEHFGQKGFVLGLKGQAYMQYRKDKFEEAYEILKESVTLEENKSKAGALTAYFQVTVKMFKGEKITKEQVIETFDLVSGYIEYQITLLKDNAEKQDLYNSAKQNVELLFGPIASCEDLIKMYGARYEANKENVDWLKRATRLMDKKECTEDPLFEKLAETLHVLEPSAESAYAMGKMKVAGGLHSKAAAYFKEAVELQTEDDKKADYYLTMANHYFRNLKQPAQARAFAQKAAAARSGWGEPYLAIANFYAASSKECGTNEFEEATVYWIAVDMCKKAKAVDASVAEEANKKIASWSQYFPGTKDCFFEGYTEGQEYTIACWINITVKVRCQE